VVISAALVACSSRSTTPRERALAQLPASAQIVAAADGPALASPSFRRVIDAMRPRIPAALGCVVDVGLTSEAVAVAVDPHVGTTIVVITRAFVGKCPLLSKVGGDEYVATLGGGTVVTDRKTAVLDDPQWARARDYLLHDPVAFAAELPGKHMVGVAQPDPLDGWFAIDALDPNAIESALKKVGKLDIKRTKNQLLVTLAHPTVDDVITVAIDLLKLADVSPSAARATLPCLPNGELFTSCKDGTHYTVKSVRDALRALTAGELVAVIGSGDIAGLRVEQDTPLILRKGDVVFGLGARRIADKALLTQVIDASGRTASLAFRRDGTEYVVELGE
jgi:hypothetical protein